MDEARHLVEERQVGGVADALEVGAECLDVVVDDEELDPRARDLLEFGIGHSGKAAAGVLHHDNRGDAQGMARQGQAAKDVLGHPAAGIADHVGIAEVEAQGGEHVDACVHAGHDCKVPPGFGIGDSEVFVDVVAVGVDQPPDLGHGSGWGQEGRNPTSGVNPDVHPWMTRPPSSPA